MRLGTWRIAITFALFVSSQRPALACQFLDLPVAITQAARDTENLFLLAGAFAVPLLTLDILQRKFSVPLLLMVPILAFHPFWTFHPFYWTNCQFQDVLVSGYLLALAGLLLAFRVVTELRVALSKHAPN